MHLCSNFDVCAGESCTSEPDYRLSPIPEAHQRAVCNIVSSCTVITLYHMTDVAGTSESNIQIISQLNISAVFFFFLTKQHIWSICVTFHTVHKHFQNHICLKIHLSILSSICLSVSIPLSQLTVSTTCVCSVIANGDVLNPAVRFLIPNRLLTQFEQILEMITEKMGLRILGGVHRYRHTWTATPLDI